MNRFEVCLAFVLRCEGGYCERDGDRGGATNQGITDAAYQRWLRTQGLPSQPVKFMAQSERDAIYFADYWMPARCPQLAAPVDLVMFDAWVQHRPTVAAQMLQRACGALVDGVLGPETLRHAAAEEPLDLAAKIIAAREQFYRAIVARDVTQAGFLTGWLNRMRALKAAAGV